MSLKRNVIANYLGQGWAALMGLAFVPLYVRDLGVEAYGLVGVFTILQAAVALLDLGLTPTLTRELARLRAGAHTAQSIRDLLRSVEWLYVVLTGAMVAAVWFGAAWLADDWLKVRGLSPPLVIQSIRIMGFVLATRWMEQVFRGALQGLQDMVWFNAAQAGLATLRWAGAFAVLELISASVTAFFVWQGLVSMLTVALLVYRTYALLPRAPRAGRFVWSSINAIRSFAGGMFVATFLGFLLMQADKIVISRLLTLDQLGFYTLAATAAGGLMQLIMPMNTAVFPRLSEQVAQSNPTDLARTYLQSCEWMSAVIVAPALMMAFFAEPVLLLWTGDVGLSHSVSGLLALLAIGTLFNGLMNLPYMLQLAHGWISLSLKINLVAVVFVVPSLFWAVGRFGAVGAAAVWVTLNGAYLLLGAKLMHGRLLPEVQGRWYRTAIIVPLCAGSAAALVARGVLPIVHSRSGAAFVVVVASTVVALTVWSTLPAVRRGVGSRLRRNDDHQPA